MINVKCPMINDQGFALITMMFFLVSFLSVVLLASYALVKEAREATGSYIIDRNDYRFRKALFGDVVDQCGTKLAHCGGHYSDYPSAGKFGTKRYYYQSRVTARVFGTLGHPKKVEIPRNYEYTADAFWAGYWGKRYLHILPSDKWDYATLYPGLGNRTHDLYAPFRQPYACIFISSICGGLASYANFAKGELTNFSHFGYGCCPTVYVQVKDHSENRMKHELRLISIGASNYYTKNDDQNIFFERVDGPTYFADYVLYEFKQDRSGRSTRMASNTGQKKLMIQVKENGSDSWVTMDTKLLVFPRSCGTGTSQHHRVNFYG